MSNRSHHTPAPLPGQKPKPERSWRFYAVIVAAIVALVLIFQNSQKVQVDFIFATTETPLIFILLITFVLGMLIGWLLPRIRRRDDKKQD